MSLNSTPRANRVHVAILGKQNSGKSSLLNMIASQDVSIVSSIKGATTDPVYKAMELQKLGACVLVDTAGIDDFSDLGAQRVEKTNEVLEKTDVAVILVANDDLEFEKDLYKKACDKNIQIVLAINDFGKQDIDVLQNKVLQEFGCEALVINAKNGLGVEALLEVLGQKGEQKVDEVDLVSAYVKKGDVVLLVMPQDGGAPKGRLILPQVQTIRALLDKQCVTICATLETMVESINGLKKAPDLIITDSQVFDFVYQNKPKQSKLTSFSILFAAYKGDIDLFVRSMQEFDELVKQDIRAVLIAEACSHIAQHEDIGRVKIPNILRKKYNSDMRIDFVNGADFPKDLSGYDLVVHCGGCMINRALMQNRIAKLSQDNIRITNYGVFLANATGILDKCFIKK